MEHYYADQLSSLIIPSLIVGFFATFVAIMFFEVFGMGTSVLLQCFIAGAPTHPMRVWRYLSLRPRV
jgi:hypothetical protein